MGRGLFEVFPDNPDDPTAGGTSNLRASLERVLATRAPDTMAVQKYDIRGTDGRFASKYWSPKNLPVLSPSGEVRYILHRVEDVTDLARASSLGESLRDRTQEMEREVIARSRELHAANTRLRETAAKLELANRELEAFNYSVSHDLRTPVRAIDGFAQALAEDYANQLDATGKSYLSRILKGAQRMKELIEALLGLSRLSLATMEAGPVDLSLLASTIIEDLRRAHPHRVVTTHVEPGLVAHGDRRLLQVVLSNLIGNAWKFTSKHVDARIEVGRARDRERAFFVRDTGAGFDPTYAQRLFAPFQRLHSADEFEGTGIGLATVRRVIARHGGRIWADATPGEGATFSFTLADVDAELAP